jgi:hypothetical protein
MKSLELRFVQVDFGLSARRLYETTELGQINVFGHPLNVEHEITDATKFIDVIRYQGEDFYLAGFTLAELQNGKAPGNDTVDIDAVLKACNETRALSTFIVVVHSHLVRCSLRQGMRNMQQPFLSSSSAHVCFGIRHIYSNLQAKLAALSNSKANAQQWLKTIDNFQKKGLRAEELEMSNLCRKLLACNDKAQQFTGLELVNLCQFDLLRLSVIPVVSEAKQQLHFARAPSRPLKKAKNLPRAQGGQVREISGFDSVLGYRIEEVVHPTLWGTESHWQAVFHNGGVIQDERKQSLFADRAVAEALAVTHARQHFPKRAALGRFSDYAWTGGESYREWLVTLPYHPANYVDGHFINRNVLAHVRCDLREGAEGEKVLMLQEVQSDWAQRTRRAISNGDISADDQRRPPLIKEWVSLAIKLTLLHAAERGLDAMTWTRGAHQIFRYKGLGRDGLIELYDRAIPREVNRLLKHLGAACENLGVFVPTNFSILQSESGYEVYSPTDELLGTALTLEDARQYVPDQGHELLFDVHGVRLTPVVRSAILAQGFPLWG